MSAATNAKRPNARFASTTSASAYSTRQIPDAENAKRDTYHHGDLKRALTDAALQLVQEKGPNGFTLREVARDRRRHHGKPL